MNLNNEIFRRTAPDYKLALIQQATTVELSQVKADTIIRCVQEVGEPTHWSKVPQKRVTDKTLKCEQVSNGWSAWFYSVSISGRDHILNYNFSGIIDNGWIDKDGFEHWMTHRELYSPGVVEKEVKYDDMKGRLHYSDFRWYYDERMEVIRMILKTYIQKKYADKLKEEKS